MMAILALYIILGLIAVIYILLRFSVRVSYSFDTTAETKLRVKVKYFFITVYENPESEKQKLREEKKKKKKEKRARKAEKSEKKRKSEGKENRRDKSPDIVDEINSLSDDETKEKIKALEREIDEQRKALLQTEIKISKSRLSGEAEEKDQKAEQKKLSKREKKELSKLKKEEKKRKKLLKKKDSKLSKLKQKWNLVKPYVPLVWKTLKKLLKNIRFYNTEIDIMLGNEDPYKAALNYGYFNTAFYQVLAFLCMVFSVKIKTCDINTEFIVKRFELKASGDIYVRVSTILAIAICFLFNMLKIYLRQKGKKSQGKHKF